MLHEFVEWVYLFAFTGALESQVHKDIGQYLILLVENIDFMAHSAFKFSLRNVLAGNLRKISKAFFAAQLGTVTAF